MSELCGKSGLSGLFRIVREIRIMQEIRIIRAPDYRVFIWIMREMRFIPAPDYRGRFRIIQDLIAPYPDYPGHIRIIRALNPNIESVAHKRSHNPYLRVAQINVMHSL
jgi:hypothetical protein